MLRAGGYIASLVLAAAAGVRLDRAQLPVGGVLRAVAEDEVRPPGGQAEEVGRWPSARSSQPVHQTHS